MLALNQITNLPEFQIVKFELDKIHGLCQANPYDGAQVF